LHPAWQHGGRPSSSKLLLPSLVDQGGLLRWWGRGLRGCRVDGARDEGVYEGPARAGEDGKLRDLMYRSASLFL